MELEGFTQHFCATFPDLVGSPIVVALSGGADSTALLHSLHRADLRLTLHAVHVHHGARGQEADEDARFCLDLCRRLDLDFSEVLLADSHSSGRGREAEWRTRRYAALQHAAMKTGASAIATAHHQDDIAEGVLLQLLRGSGPRAMAGIHARDRGIIRPFLPFSGAEIRAWMAHENLEWREDSSNRSPAHLRNRVRHEVLPVLQNIEPSIKNHLVHLARTLAETEAGMAQELERRSLWIDPWHPEGGVPVAAIARLSRALRVRWLHSQIARAGLPGATRKQGEMLHEVLRGSSTALTLADRWVLRRAAGRLWLEPGHTVKPYAIDLTGGDVELPLPGWRVTLRDSTSEEQSGRWKFPVSDQRNLSVRSLHSEDRLADGRRPMTVLRETLPRHLRHIWPMVFGGDKLLWIPGVAADTVPVDGPRIVEVTRK